MHTILNNIERTPAPDEFIIHVLVDTSPRAFRVKIRLPGLAAITPLDPEFISVFHSTNAARKIGQLVADTYRNKNITFPVDLGFDSDRQISV